MRQIFLDTETTGLYPDQGHRIIEIAAVEIFNRRATQRHFHVYINPEREIDPGAQEVHGISLEFLQDKPLFANVAEDFIAFIRGAELIIHNAPFDLGFLNMELAKLNQDKLETHVSGIIDTLKMAKEMRPGQRNNLDALCRHFGIDNSQRTLHGALLDAELLAEVYIAMTRGQESLLMELSSPETQTTQTQLAVDFSALKVLAADAEELSAHAQYIASLAKAGASSW
ncbi:DNA polymerase III subunit epsilon [Methylophilus medardicus]|uniref:DNA polymerase III subunit epsilon n=1 Tax=Methylophilus medardicus TaxID=2588534 RepID=A0A5B8CS53_9PROT|nr:DNA polymerase III subunit epsilon [Methylophilus medardicus]QDC44123.1 DNA polymerase III subunit epsilon [Methylophilus medardicus]QDC49130.1 DNA polymerase III subunit epsilon [Methylophilus medardicus]QDC52835.1 DNA polymerase III subunit epsilon [Methylophilus medardicus]